MSGETIITVIGNATSDPELRFTPSGAAVAKFTVASTPRTYDKQTNEWKDGTTLYLPVSVWRQQAEHVAESVVKGCRVVVQGRLSQRSYEDREGVKRTVYELEADEVAVSLRNATAKVTKASGGGGGSGRQEFQQSRQQQQQQSAGSGDPWGAAAQQAGQAGGSGWDRSLPSKGVAHGRGLAFGLGPFCVPGPDTGIAMPCRNGYCGDITTTHPASKGLTP
jgi:single-strand DNA-binding protein